MNSDSQAERAAEKARDRDTENYFTGCDPVSDFTAPSLLDRFYSDSNTFDWLIGDALIDHDNESMENMRTSLAKIRDLMDVIETATPTSNISHIKAEADEHAKMLGYFIFNNTRRYVAKMEAAQ